MRRKVSPVAVNPRKANPVRVSKAKRLKGKGGRAKHNRRAKRVKLPSRGKARNPVKVNLAKAPNRSKALSVNYLVSLKVKVSRRKEGGPQPQPLLF